MIGTLSNPGWLRVLGWDLDFRQLELEIHGVFNDVRR